MQDSKGTPLLILSKASEVSLHLRNFNCSMILLYFQSLGKKPSLYTFWTSTLHLFYLIYQHNNLNKQLGEKRHSRGGHRGGRNGNPRKVPMSVIFLVLTEAGKI